MGFAGDRQARGAEASVQGNFGLAALLAGDTRRRRGRVPRGTPVGWRLVVRLCDSLADVGPTDSGDTREACNGGAGTDTATLCKRIARVP